MDSTYRIVALPPDLAKHIGYDHLLVEAVELCGAAMFRGACEAPPYRPQEVMIYYDRDRAALEALFAKASEGDYLDARYASGKARDAARPNRRRGKPARYVGKGRHV